MTSLAEAVQDVTNVAYGENGDIALASSLNKCVDMYGSMGALRGWDEEFVETIFKPAWSEDKVTALALLFKLRDIRGGGMGERKLFRSALLALEERGFKFNKKFIMMIIDLGRVDDVFVFTKPENIRMVAEFIYTRIYDYVFLTKRIGEIKELTSTKEAADNLINVITSTAYFIAKWLPRKPKKDNLRLLKNSICKLMKWTPKDYRLWCSGTAATVEQLMSSKRWGDVDYNKLPSYAGKKYRKAFLRNDAARYTTWLDSLSKPESGTKVNAGTLFPYDVINRGMFDYRGTIPHEQAQLANAQWEALPNYMTGKEYRILPLVDVSGSMGINVAGSKTITAMDVAITLGMYISKRQTSRMRGVYMTFETNPNIVYIDPELNAVDTYKRIADLDWGGGTDYDAAYRKLLETARKSNLSSEEMPEVILVISDMNFNGSMDWESEWVNADKRKSAIERMRIEYESYGYEMPLLVFWNVVHNGSFQVKAEDNNVALLSGFSPSVVKDVLADIKDITPLKVMQRGIEQYMDIARWCLK